MEGESYILAVVSFRSARKARLRSSSAFFLIFSSPSWKCRSKPESSLHTSSPFWNVVHLLPDHSSLKGYRYGIGFRRNFIVNPPACPPWWNTVLDKPSRNGFILLFKYRATRSSVRLETALFQIIPDDIGIIIPESHGASVFPTSSGRGPCPRAPGEWNERRDASYAILHARADSEPSGARNSYRKIVKLLRQAPKFIHQGLSCGTVLDGNDQIRHLFHFLQAQGKQLFIRFHRGKPF